MKNQTLLAAVAAMTLWACGAQAGLFYFNSGSLAPTDGTVVDGSPVGSAFSVTLNDANITAAGNVVAGVNVTLNLSGGYNGDLYSYLVSPNGTLVVLLNQPGQTAFHNGGSGMAVTLTTALNNGSAYPDIQTVNLAANQQLAGTYSTSAGNLNNFGTMANQGGAANGTWTLYFADLVQGGGNEQLTSWSLDLTVVPEPVNVALGVFGVVLAVGVFVRRFGRTDKGASI